ncbi:MAG: NAD(P)/FAD-dependent oxidoreductase [Chitinophagales bacterium]|nr:NAD(P)/FAD-dependent oxidoreductase [Chitinophagales bacterium]
MKKYTTIIIGAGFSGIGMGIQLKRAGLDDFVILESEDGPGGTWKVNHYPGAACDVQSHLYSFSFEPNPNWSKMFGLQEEILRYQEHCCEKFGLFPHCKFNTFVKDAVFQDDTNTWVVTTQEGEKLESQFLISGSGGLSHPSYPEIQGLNRFKGAHFHSARWNHHIDLKGKRVAIIGSGASAIQIVPSIINEVAHLDYYQRTPSWVLPKPDRYISNAEQYVFEKLPFTQQIYRSAIYATLESRALGFVVSPKLMTIAKQLGIRHIHKYIKDIELRKKLTPQYEMGCKRILMSNDYYQAVARDYVDVIVEDISSVDEYGIQTKDGKYRPVDIIIFCTGFHASENIMQYEIYGSDGQELNHSWAEGPAAYLGTTVPNFPNLFIIMGPNTGLGHNSMIYMIESQIHYIMESIQFMKKKKVQAIDVRSDVFEKYNKEIQNRLQTTIWKSGCQSWYLTKSGKNTTLWPGFTFEFRARTLFFRSGDYRLYNSVKISKKHKKKTAVL